MERAINTFWTAAVGIWLVAVVATFAGAAAPPLTVTDAGYFLTVVDDNGVPSMLALDRVVDLRSNPSDPIPPVITAPPTDPVPPGPDTLPPTKADIDVATVKSVQEWAAAVSDPNGSQAVAAVYDHVQKAYGDGLLSDSSVWSALKSATDDALTIASPAVNWSTFRTHLSDLITLGRQRGTLGKKVEINRTLSSIKHGLDLSADGTPMLSDSTLVAIAIKTNEVIDAH